MIIKEIASLLLSNLIFALMLSQGLSFSRQEWRERASRRSIRATLFTALVVNPALAVLAVRVLPVGQIGAGTLVLMSICPGNPIFLRKARKLEHGQVKGITLAAMLSLAAIIYIPAAVWALNHLSEIHLAASPGEVFKRSVLAIFLPFVIGAAIRNVAPVGAKKILPWVERFVQVAFSVAIMVVLIYGVPVLLKIPAWIYLLMLILTSATAFTAYGLSGPGKVERQISASAAVFSNPGIVFYIGSISFPHLPLLAPVAAYLIIRAVTLIPFNVWSSRHADRAHDRTQMIS